MSPAPRDIVARFWEVMATNDFVAASRLLSPDYRCIWPQSSEVIEGPDAFAAVNAAYPASGPWRFEVKRLVADGSKVVTDVDITDGDIQATAVTFHTVRGALISKQVEYWPDAYDPPAWRAAYVTRL